MKQVYLLLGLILFLSLSSPVVFSLDCKTISSANLETCKEILNSDLAEEEKELLILNLDYSNEYFPDHEFIFERNSNIEVNRAPEGVIVQNKNFIKHAWAKIFAVMPSVIYNDVLYVPEKTSLLTGFNYELEVPENYYSPDYPKTSQGDCKRKYYLEENEAENKVYVNGNYVGKGDLKDLVITKDSAINIIYKINVEIKIKHYEWDRYCSSRRDDGSCRKYSEDCEYDYTEIKKEEVIIQDQLNVKQYENNLYGEISPINIYNGITNFKTNFSDSFQASFKTSEYDYHKYSYLVNYSNPPYYIATLKAQDYNKETINNLFAGENQLAVKDTTNCKLNYFDFFNKIESDCNTKYENINFFIKVEKLKYDEGEEISVKIFPDNVSAKVTYAGETKYSEKEIFFLAKRPENRITAEYNGLVSEKVIYVTDKKRAIFIWNLFILFLLNVLLYILLRKYWGKIK
jgi:hypothetical protein